MTVVRVKGLKRYFEPKSGKWYAYHRKTGKRIGAEFGTPAFFAELERIDSEERTSDPKAGTLGALIASYRGSPGFLELRPRSRSDYQKVFDYLKPLATAPLAELTQGWVAKLRDKVYGKHKRKFANYVLAVLSVAFEHGIEQEVMANNPVAKVKRIRRPKSMADANRPWTHEERDEVLAALPIHLKVPIALAMFTGLREGDALTITWSSYKDGNISTNTAKSGQPIWWKCPTTLATILVDAPRADAVQIALNSYGQPWTESGFRASWRKVKVKLEIAGKVGPGLTIHGLRHTVATTLRQEGFSLQAIADALGQKTTAMAGHYSKTADLQKNMVGVSEALDRAMNERSTGNV